MQPPPPQLFCVAKRKKLNKGKKGKSFKPETIKRLPPKSKCYCFSHCRASRIQKFFLSANHGNRQCFTVFHGPSTLKSIPTALFKTLLVLILIFQPQSHLNFHHICRTLKFYWTFSVVANFHRFIHRKNFILYW